MKFYLTMACMTLLALLTSNCIAATASTIKWYQVEIIVFSQLPHGQLQQDNGHTSHLLKTQQRY